MNKIVIVGHPTSAYQDVETLLLHCGMQAPLPSRREGLTPQDITAILCKAHQVPAIEEVVAEEEFAQIDTGTVWHGMALDLMLGNLEQPLWGWCDPQAIYTLNYWKGLDDKLTFVLVYDDPHRVLMTAARRTDALPTPEGLTRQLDNWMAYNGALLAFYLRNTDRCLMVHSQQVRSAADGYLRQLQPLLGASALEVPDELPDFAAEPATSLSAEVVQFVTTLQVDAASAKQDIAVDATEHFLVDAVLKDQPRALQLYAEMQSAASMPFMQEEVVSAQSAANAWEALVKQRAFVSELLRQVKEKYEHMEQALAAAQGQLAHESKRLVDLSATHNDELTSPKDENSQLIQQLADLKSKPVASEKLIDLTNENKLLLTQLHQVQEELERYYLENQRLKLGGKSKHNSVVLYGAAERIKRQLSYRLGAVMIQREKSPWGFISMPWALIAETKAFRKEKAERANEKLPPLSAYADKDKAERAKQHLSFRLGSTLLKHLRSPLGWIVLFWALPREMRQFKRQNGDA